MSKPWIKLWTDKWLGSARIRRCSYEELGLYTSILVRASNNDKGELRLGDRPWTLEDLAFDLGIRSNSSKRLTTRLQKLVEVGLIEVMDDGAFRVAKHSTHQGKWTAPVSMDDAIRSVENQMRINKKR